MLNTVTLIGRLGQEPDVRQTQSGDKVANVSIATTETWKDKNTGEKQEKTEWHRVVFFGNIAQVVENYVKKGDQIYIEGKLQTRKWQDQQGQDQYTTEIVVQGFGGKMIMLSSNNGNGTQQQPQQQDTAFGGQPAQNLDDDIPF